MSVNPQDPSVGSVLEVVVESWEAARGAVKKIYLPAEGGMRELSIRIPPSTNDNTLLRLSGHGPGGTDLFVRLRIRKTAAKAPVPGWFVGSFVAIILAAIVVFANSHSTSNPDNTASSGTETSDTSTYTTNTSTSDYTYSYTPYSPPAYTPPRFSYSIPVPALPEETKVDTAPEDSAGIGDCLRNDGSDTSPQMTPAGCTRGTFKILARKVGTTSSAACSGVARSTHDYVVEKYTVYYYGGVETNRIPNLAESYVLCLRAL